MSKPNYKQFILAREYVIKSKMFQIDPTCVDRAITGEDEEVGDSSGTWSEYYVIYQCEEEGVVEYLEDFISFTEASERYAQILYAEYHATTPNPKGFSEWEKTDYEEFLNDQFPNRK